MPPREHGRVPRAWNESIQIAGDRHRTKCDGAAEASDKRRPPREEPGQTAEALAQVHVFTAGLRAPRRELGICQGPRERERPAERPDREHGRGARHHRSDDTRRGEDADADDVGNDDGRRVERSQAPIERCGIRKVHAVVTW